MKTKTGIVKEAHALFDQQWSRRLRLNQVSSTCVKGCHACCSEPVMVSEAEVKVALASLPPAELPGVIERTKIWLEKIEPSGLLAQKRPDVVDWLRVGAVCPLLKDGLCLVYASRPFGCRYHTARGHPSLCHSLATRRQQTYWVNQDIVVMIGALHLSASTHINNLGVFLARWLLQRKVACAAEMFVPVTTSRSHAGTVLELKVNQ